VDELIDTFGLGRYRDTRVADLSTGTRRVLELACAAGHRPSLLLLDEPSSGLSQSEVEKMAEIVRNLAHTTGSTLAIIEHDVPLVADLSDELVCMDLGRIIARGKPNDVLTNPDVIASYLGTDQTTIARSGERLLGAKSRKRLRVGSQSG
jgi:branched-chain amino acid transport system ATP-binding protein